MFPHTHSRSRHIIPTNLRKLAAWRMRALGQWPGEDKRHPAWHRQACEAEALFACAQRDGCSVLLCLKMLSPKGHGAPAKGHLSLSSPPCGPLLTAQGVVAAIGTVPDEWQEGWKPPKSLGRGVMRSDRATADPLGTSNVCPQNERPTSVASKVSSS